MNRANGLKSVWKIYDSLHKEGKKTPLNFGRVSLEMYLRFHYDQYKETCYYCNEKSLKISQWLKQEIRS